MSTDSRAQALERVARGKEAEQELEQVTATLEARKRIIIASAFASLRKDEMGGDLAKQFWIQLYEVKELEKALSQEIRLGHKAAEKIHGESLGEDKTPESQEFPYT